MPVTVKFDKAKVLARIDLSDPTKMKQLCEIIRADCNEYCKRDKGGLIASSMTNSKLEQGRIVWNTPYARRQYYEIRTASADVNPKATWRWAEVAKNQHLDKWLRQAKKLEGL